MTEGHSLRESTVVAVTSTVTVPATVADTSGVMTTVASGFDGVTTTAGLVRSWFVCRGDVRRERLVGRDAGEVTRERDVARGRRGRARLRVRPDVVDKELDLHRVVGQTRTRRRRHGDVGDARDGPGAGEVIVTVGSGLETV